MSRSPEHVRHFHSNSPLRERSQLAHEMIADLRAAWQPAWALIATNLLTKYRQSLLGFLWAFIPPLLLAGTAVLARRAHVLNTTTTDVPYSLYVMLSTSLWQTFSEAVLGPMQLVSRLRPMLSKISFPREAIVLATIGESFCAFFPKLALIVLLFFWFDIPMGSSLVFGIVALVPLIILATVIGVLLAPLSLIYDDVARLVTLLLGVWLFFTPVLYPVPESGAFSVLVKLNPVTPLLITIRELFTVMPVTAIGSYAVVTVFSFAALLLTWLVFRIAMPFAVERLSA